MSSVSAEVLIGQEKQLRISLQSPPHGAGGVRRSADHASAFATESFNRGGRVDVSDGRNAFVIAEVGGQARAHKLFPAVFDLLDVGHIGHRASGIEIGKNHNLAGSGKNVGALGHEMHAAKDNIFSRRLGGLLRELVGVSSKIGEANHFIALIVVTEDYEIAA